MQLLGRKEEGRGTTQSLSTPVVAELRPRPPTAPPTAPHGRKSCRPANLILGFKALDLSPPFSWDTRDTRDTFNHKMVFFLYLLCICYVLFVWLVRLFFLLQSPHVFFWLCDDDACNLTDCSGNGCCFTDTPVRLNLSVCLVTAFVFAVTALMLHRRSGKQSEGETPDSIWERSNIHYILYRIP